MRTDEANAALEASISRERLAKYLEWSAGDLDTALTMYERNTMLSEAFYTPLQVLEICFRNKIDHAMRERYGQGWLIAPETTPLTDYSRASISNAVHTLERSRRQKSHGKLVAELKFAFWVSLTATPYDATLWRSTLYRAFRADGGLPRKKVHGRINMVRRFRNRIAHHEPIFHDDLTTRYAEILEAIGWMCHETRIWAERQSRVEELLDSPTHSR